MRPRMPKKRRIAASIASVAGAGELACVVGLAMLAGRRHEPLLLSQQLDLLVDRARVVHGAELRPAHRAELSALEVLGGETRVVVLAGTVRIERGGKLLVPVELVARA